MTRLDRIQSTPVALECRSAPEIAIAADSPDSILTSLPAVSCQNLIKTDRPVINVLC
jgi:hypothetical protein